MFSTFSPKLLSSWASMIFISITVVHFCYVWKYSLGTEAYYCLNWELPTLATLSLQFQRTFMFGTPFDYFVLPNPMQGNLPLRYACSAQILLSIKMRIFIQKGTMFIPARVDFFFLFEVSRHLTRQLKLSVLVARAIAVADRPRQ